MSEENESEEMESDALEVAACSLERAFFRTPSPESA